MVFADGEQQIALAIVLDLGQRTLMSLQKNRPLQDPKRKSWWKVKSERLAREPCPVGWAGQQKIGWYRSRRNAIGYWRSIIIPIAISLAFSLREREREDGARSEMDHPSIPHLPLL